MHVSEESDSGIVPMKPSNKDGSPSAEKAEGRLLVKENTCEPRRPPTQSGFGLSPELLGVRRVLFRRQSSKTRAVCANERTYGSVRGAAGDRCPYRDRQPDRCWTR
jgi:RNA-directed DNA polymerase